MHEATISIRPAAALPVLHGGGAPAPQAASAAVESCSHILAGQVG